MPKIESKNQAAFTLLELLIVILLISIFYYLVSATFKKEKRASNILTIKNINKYPLKHLPRLGAELICIDDCKRCFIYNYDTYKIVNINSKLSKLKAYIVDSDKEPIKIDFGRLKDKSICLRYRYYPNGSSSQMIIKMDNRYYYIPSYFGKIKEYPSLMEAINRYRWIEGKFTDNSDYY